MARIHHLGYHDDDIETAERQTSSLAGIAVLLCLVVMGLFLVRHLYSISAIEDCLLAGRSNCDIVIARLH